MLLCGGFITLTSCTDSIYQEIDEQNSEMNAPLTFNNENPGHAHGDTGGSGLVWPGWDYASPWDIWFRVNHEKQPNYIISNGNADRPQNYNLEIYAYIGLAYFDGDDNGWFVDLETNAQFHLAGVNYPNLYPPSNPHEAGNLVRTVTPIVSLAYPNPSHGLRLEDPDHHLLMTQAVGTITPTDRYPWLSQGQIFNLGTSITPEEEDLLRQYGKVFFYEVHVFDAATNAFLQTEILHPKIVTIGDPNAHWQQVMDNNPTPAPIQGTVPILGSSVGLYYYYDTTMPAPQETIWNGPIYTPSNPSECNSREVVFDADHLNLDERPLPGGARLKLGIAQNSQWLWQNASLYLSLEN